MHTSNRAGIIVACGICFAASPIFGQPLPGNSLGEAFTDDPEASTETAAAGPTNWLETRVAIEDLADAGAYAAALALGDRLLALVEEEFGPDSAGLAEAHLLLANVHRRAREFTDAESEILAAIALYETDAGPMSPVLISPFLSLGDNYGEAGDYASAISAYSEARTLGRRNFGLLSLEQLAIIDNMTDAAEKLGQLEEARALQLEALTLVERNFPENSPEVLDAMYKYAFWLRRQRQYDEERRLYFQIQRIVDQHYDDDPLLNIRALRERAASFAQADQGESTGVSGLREALDLLDQVPDASPRLRAEILVEIGDWNVEFSRTGAIGSEYLDAWTLLGTVENGAELREQWFDDLQVIELGALSLRGLTSDTDAPEGFVVVYFTVDTRGRTREVEVTDSRPPGLKDGAVIRLIREARFRPRIVDGELVAARRAYRFGFRYVPPDTAAESN